VAGGTGGHVFPAHAISESLSRSHRVIFYTDLRGKIFLDGLLGGISPTYEICVLSIYPFGSNIRKKLKTLFALAISILVMCTRFVMLRPALVLGFGGYTTFPVLFAAVCTGVKIILHEQNAVLGTVNKIFARCAEFIITSFANIRGLQNRYTNKVLRLGTPIRKEFFEYDPYRYRKTDQKLKILILGGSQGSSFISTVATRALVLLPKSIQRQLSIHQQISKDLESSTQAIYDKSSIYKYTISSFFHNVAELLYDADLVIARSGASTISEIEYCKKPAILIPFAAAKHNHQYYNARHLEEMGSAIICLERESTPENFSTILSEVLTTGKLSVMKNNALRKNNDSIVAIAEKIDQLLG